MLELLIKFIAPLLMNKILGSVVFLVLFVTITYLLARNQFVLFLLGLGRVILSLFYSPLIYLHNAIRRLADYGRHGEAEFARTEQYLLHKFLLILSAGSLLMAVAMVSIGLVLGAGQAQQWLAVRKDIGIRTQILDVNQADLTGLTTQIGQLDSTWTYGRETLFSAYESERQQKALAAETENHTLSRQIGEITDSDPSLRYVVSNLQYYYLGEGYPEWRYAEMRNEIERVINRSGMTTEHPAVKAVLMKYTENWYIQRVATVNIRRLNEEDLRQLIQPTYNHLMERSAALHRAIQEQQAVIDVLEDQAGRHAWRTFREPLAGIWACLMWVWIVGLMIEIIALVVLTATNIHKLREQSQLGAKPTG